MSIYYYFFVLRLIAIQLQDQRRTFACQFILQDASESVTKDSLAVGILGLIQGEGTALV